MTCSAVGTKTMQFTITFDRDEDGVWITEYPSIPGCVGQGQTKEEAIQLCLESEPRAV